MAKYEEIRWEATNKEIVNANKFTVVYQCISYSGRYDFDKY
jgi:hypothetical protein